MLLLATAFAASANPVDLKTARQVGAKYLRANTTAKVANDKELQLATTYRTESGVHYEQTMEKAEKYQEFAERNMARASTRNMAKSRLKMLERLDLTAPEEGRHTDLKFEIVPDSEPYKDVLSLENLSIGVSGRVLCSGLDLLMERGDRVAVVGNNGCGNHSR